MTTNNLKRVCDWVENSPQDLGRALRTGAQRTARWGQRQQQALKEYYRENGFWRTVGMLNAVALLYIFIGTVASVIIGCIGTLIVLPWLVSWKVGVVVTMILGSIAAALTWIVKS